MKPPKKLKVLFVYMQNRLRSPTAERVFSDNPRLEVKSAGVDKDSTVLVTRGLLEWADLVFVMEKKQRNIIHRRFKDLYQEKRITCLYIPDDFDYMDLLLIDLLKEGVTPYIGRN
jgi:predicted protein tyrosine phosphatase